MTRMSYGADNVGQHAFPVGEHCLVGRVSRLEDGHVARLVRHWLARRVGEIVVVRAREAGRDELRAAERRRSRRLRGGVDGELQIDGVGVVRHFVHLDRTGVAQRIRERHGDRVVADIGGGQRIAVVDRDMGEVVGQLDVALAALRREAVSAIAHEVCERVRLLDSEERTGQRPWRHSEGDRRRRSRCGRREQAERENDKRQHNADARCAALRHAPTPSPRRVGTRHVRRLGRWRRRWRAARRRAAAGSRPAAEVPQPARSQAASSTRCPCPAACSRRARTTRRRP